MIFSEYVHNICTSPCAPEHTQEVDISLREGAQKSISLFQSNAVSNQQLMKEDGRDIERGKLTMPFEYLLNYKPSIKVLHLYLFRY